MSSKSHDVSVVDLIPMLRALARLHSGASPGEADRIVEEALATAIYRLPDIPPKEDIDIEAWLERLIEEQVELAGGPAP